MRCEFCGYEFDDDLGRYGCPNCLGEGLRKSAFLSCIFFDISHKVLASFRPVEYDVCVPTNQTGENEMGNMVSCPRCGGCLRRALQGGPRAFCG
jgi:Zn finger protein HypA/HybF involved in hydrogenase expression